MANEKSVFKIWSCKCGYKKHDCNPGKVAPLCKHDQRPMVLSDAWYARTTRDGVTKTVAVSPRKQDAVNHVADCKQAARKGDAPPVKEKDIRWEQAARNCEKWWGDAVLTGDISSKTRDFYAYRMKNLNHFFSGKTLLGITKGDMKDYQAFRAKEGAGATTINHERTTLRRVYSMHTSERTSEDKAPQLFSKARDIGSAPKLKKAKVKVRFLEAAEIATLLRNAVSPLIRCAILLDLNTGLRRGNIQNLTWKQVSFERRTIEIPGDQMKNGESLTVEISEKMVEHLKKWRTSQLIVSPWVFPRYDGKGPIDRGTFTILWGRTMKASKINLDESGNPVPKKDRVTVHTLRHTYASQFLMAGGDLATLSELLGHANISITKDTYGHLSREHKRKEVDEFADSFLNQFV